jgi:hypothetical protein
MAWGEMKQNAECLSGHPKSGGQILYRACKKSKVFSSLKPRLHLIGHSAGSIVHRYVVSRLIKQGLTFETLNLMAPAVRMDVFQEHVVPSLKSKAVRQMNQFHQPYLPQPRMALSTTIRQPLLP